MPKAELIKEVAGVAGVSLQTAKNVVDQMVAHMRDEIKQTGKFTLTDFGTFTKVGRRARMGRDPRTGKPIQIPAKMGVKFNMSAFLKAETSGW